MLREGTFFACYGVLASVVAVANWVLVPVPLQMLMYTLPIVYIGSHLSLKMNEVDPISGKKTLPSETVSRNDAMLFPIFGSAALFSLYLAYRFLPPYWVNLLLTGYLGAVGVAAVAETILVLVERVAPPRCRVRIVDFQFQLPSYLANPDGPYQVQADYCGVAAYGAAATLTVVWLYTHHWTLHNVIAIGFSVQAIRLISVGNFSIATILLCGLFVYDIFWVFGTEVMVKVATSFKGPAKFIFPTSYDPWQQSILGLGDVVIPGVFMASILRFDCWMHNRRADAARAESAASAADPAANSDIDIHASFRKTYFVINLACYAAGLGVTVFVMIAFKSAQPALLYLVPACLGGLYGTAFLKKELSAVFEYSEEEPAAAAAEEEETKDGDPPPAEVLAKPADDATADGVRARAK